MPDVIWKEPCDKDEMDPIAHIWGPWSCLTDKFPTGWEMLEITERRCINCGLIQRVKGTKG